MQIKIDLKGLADVQAKLASLSGKQINSALTAALNKTAAKGQAELTRAITERYSISAADVRNSVTLRKASATQGQIEATISVFGSTRQQGRSLNMIHFAERKVTMAQGKRRRKDGTLNQLRFNIIKGSGSKTILGDASLKNGAFIGNKGRTIFQRTGKARTPIKPVQVIGVSQMFMFRKIHDRVISKINSEFSTEINRAIDGKLKGYL